MAIIRKLSENYLNIKDKKEKEKIDKIYFKNFIYVKISFSKT